LWSRGRVGGMDEHIEADPIEVDPGDVLLAVGTMKGA
jgi:hypothetical protein